MELFYILNVVASTARLYIFVNTHRTVHFQTGNFIERKLYLNRPDFFKKVFLSSFQFYLPTSFSAPLKPCTHHAHLQTLRECD